MNQGDRPPVSVTPLQQKWGEALHGGFVVIPSVLFRRQAELRLSDGEAIVLMNLLMSWWKAEDQPYPRTSTLAQRMGVSKRSVQRHIEGLVKKKLIQRIWSGPRGKEERAVVRYDLGGIVAELKRLGAIPHPARQLSVLNTLVATA